MSDDDDDKFKSKGRTAKDKAVNFGLWCKSHGWEGSWEEDDDTHIVHLSARRENETVDVWWQANGACIQSMLPVYSLAGEKIKLRNVSAAAVRVAGKPEEARVRKAVRSQRRQLDAASPTHLAPDEIEGFITSLQGTLPFDHESSDDEIMDMLYGRTITWINRQSGQQDSATVGGNTKHFKVIRNGHDYINFVYPIPARVLANFGKTNMEVDTFGFRSVYLDSIVSVSS